MEIKRGCGNTEKGIRFWKSPGPIENTLRCVFAYTRTVPNDYGSTDLHEQPTGSEWNFLLRGQRHSPVGRFLSYSSSSLLFFILLFFFISLRLIFFSLSSGRHSQTRTEPIRREYHDRREKKRIKKKKKEEKNGRKQEKEIEANDAFRRSPIKQNVILPSETG